MKAELTSKNQELYYQGSKYIYGSLYSPLRQSWILVHDIILLLVRVGGDTRHLDTGQRWQVNEFSAVAAKR